MRPRSEPARALSLTEYAVLGLLERSGDASGYDLVRRINRSVGYMWAPAKTQTYAALERLQTAGLAAAPRTVKARGPAKSVYTITASGRRALRAWLRDPSLEVPPPRVPFLLKLFFAREIEPGSAVALVESYRQHIRKLLSEWEAQIAAEPDASALELIPIRFGIAQAHASLGWCDETIGTLRRAKNSSARRHPQRKP